MGPIIKLNGTKLKRVIQLRKFSTFSARKDLENFVRTAGESNNFFQQIFKADDLRS